MIKLRTELPEKIRQDFKTDYVEILPYHNKRSNNQNSLYWAWITIIAKEVGLLKEEVHDYFLQEFIGNRVERILDKLILRRATTTILNTKEFGEYLDKIENWSWHTLTIKLPTIDDLFSEITYLKRGKQK